MDKKQDNKSLQVQLTSKDENVVLEALNDFKEHGTNELLWVLADLLKNSPSDNVKAFAFSIFCDLTLQDSSSIMMEIITHYNYLDIRKELLASCWQSRINYIAYLEKMIDFVMDEPFETALEAFTIVENIQGRVSDERKAQLIEYSNKAISRAQGQNLLLAEEIPALIQNYMEA